WKLSFKEIKKLNPVATRILNICAFLQPDAIPASLFQRQHDSLGLFHKTISRSLDKTADQNVQSAIGILVEFSFLRRNNADMNNGIVDNAKSDANDLDPNDDMLAIHRVVQMVVQDSMKISEPRSWLKRNVVGALKSTKLNRTDIDTIKSKE